MKNRIKLTSSLLAAILIFGHSSQAFAEVYAYAYGSGDISDEQSGPSGPVQAASIDQGYNVLSISEASADYGVLKVYGEGGHPPGWSQGSTLGKARWTDTFLFESATLDGQAGYMTIHFRVDGSVSVSSPGLQYNTYGEVTVSVGKDESPYNDYYSNEYRLRGDGSTLGDMDWLNTDIPLEIAFTYGTPFALTIQLQSSLIAWDTGDNVIMDFSHTSTWEGITGVVDSSHNPATDYSFSSTSGVNYLNAVPEPSTTALLIGGATTIFAALRRRKN